tara:strand:- start:142 stop:510 length:369 start_codon:yes stop_codon:yes gene_type:complete
LADLNAQNIATRMNGSFFFFLPFFEKTCFLALLNLLRDGINFVVGTGLLFVVLVSIILFAFTLLWSLRLDICGLECRFNEGLGIAVILGVTTGVLWLPADFTLIKLNISEDLFFFVIAFRAL